MAGPMTDEDRKSIAVSYFKLLDDGQVETTERGSGLLELFANDAEFCFPKWGVARGINEIRRLFGDVGAMVAAIRHDYTYINWIFSGTDLVVAEGTSQGVHRDGSRWTGRPGWCTGRWCDVFEIRDGRIHRLYVYLDPDYAGKDTERYPWLARTMISGTPHTHEDARGSRKLPISAQGVLLVGEHSGHA
jgi:ketosteroid isomerase-like protein